VKAKDMAVAYHESACSALMDAATCERAQLASTAEHHRSLASKYLRKQAYYGVLALMGDAHVQ
jgi:hypothetical protein